MNSTYIISKKHESNIFTLNRPNEFNSHYLVPIGEAKIFYELDVHHA